MIQTHSVSIYILVAPVQGNHQQVYVKQFYFGCYWFRRSCSYLL